MVKLNRIFLIYSIALVFLIGPFSWTWSGERDMVLKFQDRILSASLQGVPLRVILEELERQKGVWFKGADSLFDDEVTVQFTALTLEDGIKRILASKNYSLVFDRVGELAGVVVIGRVVSDVAAGEGKTFRVRRSISSKPPRNHVNDVGAFEETETLEVTKKIQPSGGPVEVTKEELANFKVIKNSPPPGGPVKVTEEELENFKIVRNCPPPGGPVEVTAKELQNFKITKNCPPPGS
jgi:hypothetical protein